MRLKATLCLLISGLLMAADSGRLTDAERTFLVDQLEQSKKNVLESIAGLTPAQWTFKAAPDRWSVQQCAEHIILAEGYIFGGSQKLLETPAVPRPEKSNSTVDHMIVTMVTDRSRKLTAPEPLVPSGKFATPEDAAKAFTEARDKSIAYAKTTDAELRVHVGPGPAGPMDAYQVLLLMASHSARHTAQIREVEADPNFPKAAASLRELGGSRRSVGF
jgi:DinB family protein